MHKTNIRFNRTTVRNRAITSIFAASALALAISSPATAESNLTIEQSSFDFGYAPQKSKLTHVFWLKSTGTELLKIAKIVPG